MDQPNQGSNKLTTQKLLDEIILENNNIMHIFSDNNQNISASIVDQNSCVVKNSFKIIQLIGQQNFNIVYFALTSLLNEELKINAIKSLLCVEKLKALIDRTQQSSVYNQTSDIITIAKPQISSVITNNSKHNNILVNTKTRPTITTLLKPKLQLINKKQNRMKLLNLNQIKVFNIKSILEENNRLKRELSVIDTEKVERSSQTDILTPESLFKVPKKRKRPATTCVVKEADSKPMIDLFYNEEKHFIKAKKTIIDPEEFKKTMFQSNDAPDLLDEMSCMSVGSNISNFSIKTEIIEENAKFLLNMTQQHTQEDIHLQDMIKAEAVDDLHIATPYILSTLTTVADKCKLLYQQAFLDWKHSLIPNELDKLPIHEAAINDDIDLLRRQCVILRARGESVDIGDGCNNMSALQLAIQNRSSPAIISTLLQHGADVLDLDDDNCTAFHYAAQYDKYHTVLVTYCRDNIRSILTEHNLWEQKTESQDKQMQMLFNKISTMFNNEGYNPLMIGSRLGNHPFVAAVLHLSADHVNTAAPNSGNTPLYLAVEHYILADCCNEQRTPSSYLDTIHCLIQHGADPGLCNLSGFTVFALIQDEKHHQLTKILLNSNDQTLGSLDLFTNAQCKPAQTKPTGKSADDLVTRPNSKKKVKILSNVVVNGKSVLTKKFCSKK